MEGKDGIIPLGICRQAVMKLDAFIADIHEICEDPDITNEHRADFKQIAEMAGYMQAHIVNIVSEECGEEEFLSETFPMDAIEEYPDFNAQDIMDMNLEDEK